MLRHEGSEGPAARTGSTSDCWRAAPVTGDVQERPGAFEAIQVGADVGCHAASGVCATVLAEMTLGGDRTGVPWKQEANPAARTEPFRTVLCTVATHYFPSVFCTVPFVLSVSRFCVPFHGFLYKTIHFIFAIQLAGQSGESCLGRMYGTGRQNAVCDKPELR